MKFSRTGAERLTMASKKYIENNDVKNLINLFLATRGTKLLDREDLCTKILTICGMLFKYHRTERIVDFIFQENVFDFS